LRQNRQQSTRFAGCFYGSDGTRTRDRRRDKLAVAQHPRQRSAAEGNVRFSLGTFPRSRVTSPR
jgi:hypothetical protein